MALPHRGSFGSFHVRADLGRGRFGPMYRGETADTGEPVIIRTVEAPLEPAQQEALLESLQWLCETPLDHPAIGQPLACGLEGETPFLVHAVVSGTPLDEFLDRRGPVAVDEAIVRITQLAGAVDFAAAAGVHHGALDRRDVFLSAHHTALAGFGLAQAVGHAGVPIEGRGPYHSLQQQAGEAPTRADDIYALAVLALQLLCGRASDEDVPAQLLGMLQDAGLSPALRAAFEAALAEDAVRRPDRALAFAAALQGALAPAPAGEPGHDAASSEREEPLAGVSMHGGDRPSVPMALSLELAADTEGSIRPDELSLLPDFPTESPAGGRPEAHGELPMLLDRSDVPPARAREGRRRPPDPQADALTVREDPASGAAGGVAAGQLPLELSLGRPADGPLHEPVSGDPFGTVDPWSGGGPPDDEAPVAGGRDLFAREEPGPSRRPWLVGAAVLAVLLLAGVAGVFLLGRTTGSVPFPRSAAPFQDASEATDTPPRDTRTAPEPVAPGRTVIPDAPVIGPIPVPDPVQEPIEPVAGRDGGTPDVTAPADPLAASPAPAAAASDPAAPAAAPRRPDTATVPAAPSPRPEPPPGRILVRSTPAGAQVLVNGEPRGMTPLAVRELSLGAHTIEVTHPSYGSRQQRVTLTDAVPARSSDFELDRLSSSPVFPAASQGALQVESRPAGAQVFLNDRLVGTTPLVVSDLAAGAHVVRLELPGYRRWTTSVMVVSGEQARVAASLEP